jgi:hypothetical protein
MYGETVLSAYDNLAEADAALASYAKTTEPSGPKAVLTNDSDVAIVGENQIETVVQNFETLDPKTPQIETRKLSLVASRLKS